FHCRRAHAGAGVGSAVAVLVEQVVEQPVHLPMQVEQAAAGSAGREGAAAPWSKISVCHNVRLHSYGSMKERAGREALGREGIRAATGPRPMAVNDRRGPVFHRRERLADCTSGALVGTWSPAQMQPMKGID